MTHRKRFTYAPHHFVPPSARNAWLALADALEQLTDQGLTVVCQSRPDQWFSSDATARRDAAEACGYCPIVRACGAYAQAAADAGQPEHGVWAGKEWRAA